MLRLGIKRTRVEVVPELTEREQFDAELKKMEKEIIAQVLEEKNAVDGKKKKKSNDPHSVTEQHKKRPPTRTDEKNAPISPASSSTIVKNEALEEDPTTAPIGEYSR